MDLYHRQNKKLTKEQKEFNMKALKTSGFSPEPEVSYMRVVPAFSNASRQKNVIVESLPRTHVRWEKPPKKSKFLLFYDQQELPVEVVSYGQGLRLKWNVDIANVDYELWLPVFFEGLRYTETPHYFIARQGVSDMIHADKSKVYPLLPLLIYPIREALETYNKEVMCNTLTVIVELLQLCPEIGRAIVPHYRKILPILNRFRGSQYIQMKLRGQVGSKTLGNLIDETVQLFEKTGGVDAYMNIKYLMPLYMSCVHNQ